MEFDFDLTDNQIEVINSLRNKKNIVGVSGGKDSVATAVLLDYFDVPFEIVSALVWWKKDISGENPYHYDFLLNKLFPYFEDKGITVHKISSDKTAYDYMTTPIKASKEHPEREGKLRGFPLCGKCGIQRDLKTRPCEKFYKTCGDFNKILGICSDESHRLGDSFSILNLLGVKKWQTYSISKQAGLLSPTYNFSERGGCWFCGNQKLIEWELLYREFPELWNELMEIQKMPNKCTELITRTQSLYDIENDIKAGVQMKLFYNDLF